MPFFHFSSFFLYYFFNLAQEEPSGLVGLFAEPIIGLIIGGISTGVILLLLLLAGIRVHNSSGQSDRGSGASSSGSAGGTSNGGCSASSSGLNHQHSNSIGSLIAHHQSPNVLNTSTLPRGHSIRTGQSNYHRSSLSQLVVSTNSTSPILTPVNMKSASGATAVATVTSLDGHNNSTTNTILGSGLNSGSNYAQILHHNSVNYMHHQNAAIFGGGGGGSIGSNSIGGSSSIGGSVGYGTLTRTGHYGLAGGASGNNHHHILPHQGSSDHSASSVNPSNPGHHLSKSGNH